MKKIILPLAAGLVLFASCKKDYTCTCNTVQTTQPTGQAATVSTSTSTTEVIGVKKSFVEDKMECYSENYSYSYNWGGTSVLVTVEHTCEISK